MTITRLLSVIERIGGRIWIDDWADVKARLPVSFGMRAELQDLLKYYKQPIKKRLYQNAMLEQQGWKVHEYGKHYSIKTKEIQYTVKIQRLDEDVFWAFYDTRYKNGTPSLIPICPRVSFYVLLFYLEQEKLYSRKRCSMYSNYPKK